MIVPIKPIPVAAQPAATFEPVTQAQPAAQAPPAKRPMLGLLAMIFGRSAAGIGLLGCLLYFVVWRTLESYEQVGVVLGVQTPGAYKLGLPVLLNYLAFMLAIASIVLAIIPLCLAQPKKDAITAFIFSGGAIIVLISFWIWTVSRDPHNYRHIEKRQELRSKPKKVGDWP